MAQISLPGAPSVVAGHGRAAILTADGELLLLPVAEAAARLRSLPPPMLVHGPATFRRLGFRGMPAFDLLELFAFALPARPAAPTPRGLALMLDFEPPAGGLEAEAALLPEIAAALLHRLSLGRNIALNRDAAGLAATHGPGGLGLGAIRNGCTGPARMRRRRGRHCASGSACRNGRTPRPCHRLRLIRWEKRRRARGSPPCSGQHAEQRPGQADYAGAAAAAFAPRETRGDPHLVLAEAGTGTGKTLGYLAPASLWAEKNHGGVWISTFTRHLQRQIDAELTHLFPDPTERHRRVVVRKGRENYLCLLNLEDALGPAMSGLAPASVIPLGLVARWALVTDDGDIQGGDLPGWLAELFGTTTIFGLADRRGECIHAACPHWRRCFVEHTIRRARTAQLVVANHALVMAQAAWGGLDDSNVPTRYVFDEGHHVFDAADSAFSAELSGPGDRRTAPLAARRRGRPVARPRPATAHRRTRRRRAPCWKRRSTRRCSRPARFPHQAGPRRLAGEHPDLGGLDAGRPNPTEAFLRLIRHQVAARTDGDPRFEASYGATECDVFPLGPGVAEAADRLARALSRIAEPLATLRERLLARLDEEADDMDAATRNRIEAAARSLNRRAVHPLSAWQGMLRALNRTALGARQPPGSHPVPATSDAPAVHATSISGCTATGSTRPSRSPQRSPHLRRACW